MQQLVTTAPHLLELRDVPDIKPGPDEALLAVEAVGICGSDLHLLSGDHPYARFPIVQGHEFGGRIESLPAGYAGPLRVGGRVAVEPLLMCGTCLPCRRGHGNACVRMRTYGVHLDGGLSERLPIRVDRLVDAEDLDAGLVALVETTSIALQALSRGRVSADDTVAMLGAGPIGLAVTIAATARGARVMLVDRLASRLALGHAIGAEASAMAGRDDVHAAVREWTSGEGPTVVIEATGVPQVVEQAVELVAPTGTVVVLGLSRDSVTFPMVELTRKELTIVGSRNNAGRFGDAMALVRQDRERVARLISHRFPLEGGADAFRLAHDAPGEVVKVLIDVAGSAGTRP